MRRRLLTVIAAAVFALSAVAGAGAYWTADPGPDPDRCEQWQEQGSRYFDLYNCVWVDEGNSSSGGTAVVFVRTLR